MSNEDEDYDSGADEDFAPNVIEPNEDESSSEDEADGASHHQKPAKRSTTQHTTEDLDFSNSGDEATTREGLRRKRKHNDDAEDSGGEGGLVKTRAQKRALIRKAEKRALQTGTSNVDVDALWAEMAGSKKQDPTTESAVSDTRSDALQGAVAEMSSMGGDIVKGLRSPPPSHDAEMITIKRRYEFAGQTHEEVKTVLATSEEARLYREEQSRALNKPAVPSPKPGMRRPTKRKNLFEGIDLDNKKAGPKLNTLQKSKLDWAAHVDNEGISEELTEHRKGKDTYLGKLDFLGRSDEKLAEGWKTKTK
ncbi:hypothetical protein MRB53_036849 [Persea americana]|nr:hypothetical protein MRB53_036849 [Persea americana]